MLDIVIVMVGRVDEGLDDDELVVVAVATVDGDRVTEELCDAGPVVGIVVTVGDTVVAVEDGSWVIVDGVVLLVE